MPEMLFGFVDTPPVLIGQISAFFTFVANHWQFCLLHFLEFAIWGAWFVVLGNLLNARGFSRTDIGRIYACMPIGSMITPLFIGPIADNYVNTEVLIGISHLVGAVLLFLMAKASKPRPFYWLTLVYALAYSPTLGLVNSIVFAHDKDIFGGEAQAGFPWIRVFGTIGWILAGMSLALLIKKNEKVNEKPLVLAAVLSLILGVFAFTLPSTPPANAKKDNEANTQVAEVDDDQKKDQSDEVKEEEKDEAEENAANSNIFTASLSMITNNPIFFGVTFFAAMGMGLYFAFAALFIEKSGIPSNTVGPVMTIGQWIEIFFMLTLPWFLGKDNANMNWVLLTGVIAWALRFGMFAVGKPMAMILFGVAIHGICFDFFFAAGFINVDRVAPAGMTATAQTLYGFLVYGLGMYLGSEGAGFLNQYFTRNETDASGQEVEITNWRKFWMVPFVIMGVCAALFLIYVFSN